MSSETAPSPEMEKVLKRYLQIQTEEQRLKEEKGGLQTAIAGFLDKEQTDAWFPLVDGLKLKILCRTVVSVEYDEAKLRDRLGERYRAILAPDIKKIRSNMGKIQGALEPVMDLIGSPAPDKVRQSMETGVTKRDEFAGAFEKTTARKVSVMKMKSDSPESDEGQSG